jgi:hypothetical protein
MKRKLFLIALCVAVWSACNGIVGSGDDNFVFDSVRVNYDSAMVNNAEAFAALRQMQIDGLILLPHPCHTVTGEYRRVGAQIQLTVVATPTNTTCTAEMVAMQYRLQTFGMQPGPYRVRVYHKFGTQQTLIAEQDIVVG